MSRFNEQIMSFIRERLGEAKVRPIAIACGLNPSLVCKWLTGEKNPTLRNISVLLDYLGVTVHLPDRESTTAQTSGDFEFIPKVKAVAGAGSSCITSGETVGVYPFPKPFLSGLGLHSRGSILLDVIGDSMLPTIKNGDTILVDTSDTTLRDGRIYLVGLGEELLVKHVQRGAGGFILRSENPMYADINVDASEVGTLAVVHGRVRWVGKVL